MTVRTASNNATTYTPGDAQIAASQYLMHNVLRRDKATLAGNPLALLTADIRTVVTSQSQKSQSGAGAPIVVCKELTRTHGDRISLDMLHDLRELPVVGEENVEGKEEGLDRSQFEMRIDMIRKPVYGGSRMAQQMRGYDLIRAANNALDTWWGRYHGELMMYHMAGARGSYMAPDMIVPPIEPEFNGDGRPRDRLARCYTNPLRPPTFDRAYYGGQATSIDAANGNRAIQQTDTLDVASIKAMAVDMEMRPFPLAPITLAAGNKVANTSPMYIFLVSPQQYADCENSDPRFQDLVNGAMQRVKGWDHPLFQSEMFMVNKILVIKAPKPVEFLPGDLVKVSNDDMEGTTRDAEVPANVKAVHRACLLGAQGLALAFAGDTTGMVFKTFDERFDADDKYRRVLRWMGGFGKVYQYTNQGYKYDMGIATMDTAVSRAARRR